MTSTFQEENTSVSESFSRFYNRLIDQLPGIGLGLLIIILGVLIGTMIGNFARNRISHRTNDPLMSRFLGKAIRFVIIITAIMLALRAAGLNGIATGILTAAGAGAVVLGFAFKDIGENFISGIILAFNRPFNIDDTVEIGANFGKVKALEFRYTKLKTFDGKDVYIPNSDVFKEPVTNFTEDGFFRWNFKVGIDYDDDISKAKICIMEALKKDPMVIEDASHANFVIEDELATSTVNLKVFFWVDTKDFRMQALITKGNVVRNVKEALMQNGFYLPSDIQEIKLYGAQRDSPIRLQNESKNKEL
ncbi:mechanosensitive ion channel protein MscS [Christiangramia fulva]|uniref:Mechanosensitive ion channel protein MscS n=1 Tax=Christiangramia fulva TaxID=2126553 RepID=A0A2R3Z7Q1_9FLAO|nr:mechanosensitive ion channel family protein [Christiangramia fulva]AVR46300.1 mechanosensitive ion channel protein MscS [Christiangramia fulva]